MKLPGLIAGWRRRSPLTLILVPVITLAAIVSAADIVAAIQNSPNASPWLKQNAHAVANLAINVESRGDTNAYNGSCCYGVLQMNRANIREYAGVTPEAYRQQSLQEQINAWASLTTDAMNSSVVRDLLALGTFDGRPVDGNLVLACVQLGIGNCRRMINSRRCSGFADSNGTTICGMADRMVGGTGNSPGGTGGTGGGTNPGTGGGGGGWKPIPEVPVAPTMEEGFRKASGQSMGNVRKTILTIGIGATALIVGSALLSVWRRYAKGGLAVDQFARHALQAGLLLTFIAIAMTVA
ncbi:hypothetical protein [Delftia acidovorans]|uniref:Transglycosylase SLT domain-containing protein n=1 Tax=Delftia acidovorans TaxID=80866 RepID=A0AAJ2VGA6_DELAC|nr:hypothetical protein [Delftia acidovorans]MDX4957792.1 hypothetical protein [Delftia acidovorans]